MRKSFPFLLFALSLRDEKYCFPLILGVERYEDQMHYLFHQPLYHNRLGSVYFTDERITWGDRIFSIYQFSVKDYEDLSYKM